MSLVLAEEVALARSARATSSTLSPRPAASRAMPTPLMPPPTTRRSKVSLTTVMHDGRLDRVKLGRRRHQASAEHVRHVRQRTLSGRAIDGGSKVAADAA